MTIFKNKSRAANYTQIENSVIRDKSLSFKARGIHHLLLSYPENWEINLGHLVNQSDKDGRAAIASGVAELEALGYLKKMQIRSEETGLFSGYEYHVFEAPQELLNPECENRITVRKSAHPEADYPITDYPITDNQHHKNKYRYTNKDLKNKESDPERKKERKIDSDLIERTEPAAIASEARKPSPRKIIEQRQPESSWGGGDSAKVQASYTEKPTEKPWYGGGTRNNPELAEGFTEYMELAWWPSSWQKKKGHEFRPAFLTYLRFADPSNPVHKPEGVDQYIEVKAWWSQFQAQQKKAIAPPADLRRVDYGEHRGNAFFQTLYADLFASDAEKLFKAGAQAIVVTGVKKNSKAFAVDILKDGKADRIVIEKSRFSTDPLEFLAS